MKDLNIFGVHWIIWFSGGGGVNEKPIYRGRGLPKKVGFAQFADLRRGLGKKEGGVFEG